ncbi:MAG: hypothetical protein JNM62_03755 [Flavobacteriales bacterium]|nr:hypothetical protein [Flavobacteriales bacterium]
MSRTRILFWAARITGTVWLLFLLFMLVGHLTGDANGPHGMRFNGTREVVGFVLFPVCSIAGLALAYARPGLGAALVVGSLVAIVAIQPHLLQPTFLLMLLPGVLYALYAWSTRRATA